MPTYEETQPRGRTLKAGLVLAAATALAALSVAPAQAGDGGTGGGGTGGGSGGSSNAPAGHAKIVHGLAVAPRNAPARIVDVIDAANKIAKGKDYCYGGGHARFKSRCYDCSGSVSYALHGGHFLRSPMDSSGFARWARRGKGNWMTVYTNPGHAFLVVAGLRFDTSDTRGAGPGWARGMGYESPRSYKKRHKGSY